LEICRELRVVGFVLEGSVECWIEGFRDYVRTKGEELPLSEGRFMYYLERWTIETEEG